MSKESPQQIIDRHSQEAPVNLIGIAGSLGLTVLWEDLGPEIAGAIKKENRIGEEEHKYVILVNKADNHYRQRFTIAHEIAHFLFHKPFIGDGLQEDVLYRSKLSNSMERVANMMAASMLMPNHLVTKLIKEHNWDVEIISKKLQVSRKALEITLASYKNRQAPT